MEIVDSHEYEFDSLFDATYKKDVDMVHAYANPLEVGEGSGVRSNEFGSINVYVLSTTNMRIQINLNIALNEIALGVNLLVHAFNDYTMNTLEPVTSPPILHPELID